MKQESFSDMEYRCRKRKTKREEFLEIIPWEEWVCLVVPHYPSGKRGGPPIAIETMPRMYLLQCWFDPSDEDVEDAIYDSYAMRRSMGINFSSRMSRMPRPCCTFGTCWRRRESASCFLTQLTAGRGADDAGRHYRGRHTDQCAQLHKNVEKKRDPEMHSVKKEDQRHFGMKCHTGVDARVGFVHTVEATAANVHDVTVAAELLRKDDEVVYGDNAYLGIEKQKEIRSDPQLSAIEYRINRRPGRLPKVSGNAIDWERYIENRKSSVRCKVEHPYRIVKNLFGFRKAVYRGLRKNLNRSHVLFASANLYRLAKADCSLSPV